MARRRSTPGTRAANQPRGAGPRLSRHRLQKFVRAATLDADGEEEQITGLLISLEDNLDLPFKTRVLGFDAAGRPCFLRDLDMTLEELTRRLRESRREGRSCLVGKLMRRAKPDDVFTFVTTDEIVELWPTLERYLGRQRAFWLGRCARRKARKGLPRSA